MTLYLYTQYQENKIQMFRGWPILKYNSNKNGTEVNAISQVVLHLPFSTAQTCVPHYNVIIFNKSKLINVSQSKKYSITHSLQIQTPYFRFTLNTLRTVSMGEDRTSISEAATRCEMLKPIFCLKSIFPSQVCFLYKLEIMEYLYDSHSCDYILKNSFLESDAAACDNIFWLQCRILVNT